MADISVVLPTHNGARYLRDSIDSCLAQTHRAWELVVVDDGSTDETPALLAGYADPRVRVLRHGANCGLAAALNTGFAASRGALLTWTSDDNLYLPRALERMAEALERHPEIDFVYADQEFIDERGVSTGRFVVEEPTALLHTNPVNACFLYRRRVYEVVGAYAEDLPLVEDYDYWLRVSLSFRMMALHETLYRYRRHAQSLTARSGSARRAVGRKAWCRHALAIPWADAQAKASACVNRARRSRFEGRVGDMLDDLALAVRIAPGWTVLEIARHVRRAARARAIRARGR